jgi:hypothetical protein
MKDNLIAIFCLHLILLLFLVAGSGLHRTAEFLRALLPPEMLAGCEGLGMGKYFYSLTG